ncbi:MAG: hypothetical protein CM1200mP18_14830 [Gammaproteobacteria bacterium]|nr:MAG: hypothetical protein CM1200mP18_14830 [Gammaproteobacteria bacterium]
MIGTPITNDPMVYRRLVHLPPQQRLEMDHRPAWLVHHSRGNTVFFLKFFRIMRVVMSSRSPGGQGQ